jgi:hypothetical protein
MGQGRRHWGRQTWGGGGNDESEGDGDVAEGGALNGQVLLGVPGSRAGSKEGSREGTLGQQNGDPSRYASRLVGGTRRRTALGGMPMLTHYTAILTIQLTHYCTQVVPMRSLDMGKTICTSQENGGVPVLLVLVAVGLGGGQVEETRASELRSRSGAELS